MATSEKREKHEKREKREKRQEEYVDITQGVWYNLSQVRDLLDVGRSQVSTMVENGVLHPKRTRVNRKIKVVDAAEVEEARKQLEAIKRLRGHMEPVRSPRARLLQPALS